MKQGTLLRQLQAAAGLAQPFSVEEFAVSTYGRTGRTVGAAGQILRRLAADAYLTQSSRRGVVVFELSSFGRQTLHDAQAPAPEPRPVAPPQPVTWWHWVDPFTSIPWSSNGSRAWWWCGTWVESIPPDHAHGQWVPAPVAA